MPNPRLASRYAKSLIDLAIEKNELEAVYQDAVFMQDLMQASPELVKVLKSPVIQNEKKEKILEALTKGRLGVISSSFNRLLIRKGRENHLPEIAHHIIQQYKDYKGIHVVTLTTAMPASEEVKATITSKIMENSGFKQVELKTLVNPDIIGGFIIEVDGRLIDASILYDLSVIKKQFESNDFIYKIR